MRISDWSSDVCSSDLLVDRLDFFARHDDARRRTAEAGWRAAHSMFASHRIAKYILERSFDEALSESYPWPTAIDSNPHEGRTSSAGRSIAYCTGPTSPQPQPSQFSAPRAAESRVRKGRAR